MRRDLLLKFGSLVRQYRLELDRTQQDLAATLGIAQSSYSAYETGLAFPTVPILLMLLRELEIPLADLVALVSDDDEPNGDHDEVAA
jgi:transcriptional regulator with XRE-family HTH domain